MNVLSMRPLSRKRRVTTESATLVRYAGAQNATPVEETLCNRSKSAAKTIPVKDTAPGRPGRPVEETLRKRWNATPAEETPSRCSEDDSCRRNRTCVLRMRALSHKLHLSSQNVKYCRNRIGNEHRVCNQWFTYEIQQKSHWERT